VRALPCRSSLSTNRIVRCAYGFLAALVLTGCGYQMGAPFNSEVRSIYVPVFTSSSNRRGLEFQLTEAVQKQIQQRTHFQLVTEAQADTKLSGRIVDVQKSVLGQTGNSDPRELQVNLQVEVTWEDLRTGKILRQEQIPIAPETMRLAAQAELAPEVGQSLATAKREVIDRLARNIVDMMETPW
jgi:Lipopolysaccharide-assembly